MNQIKSKKSQIAIKQTKTIKIEKPKPKPKRWELEFKP